MPVIVCTSPKGGVGKSTSSIVLATEFSHRGIDVVVIDTDKNQACLSWKKLSEEYEGISVTAERDPDTIIDVIEEADQDGRIVIVDNAGGDTLLNTSTMSRADLVLLMTQAAAPDVKCAHDARKSIRSEERRLRRNIPYVVVVTRTPSGANFLTKDGKNMLASFEATGTPVIRPFLSERSHYKKIHALGGGLRDMPDHKTLPQAISESEKFATSVFDHLVAVVEDRFEEMVEKAQQKEVIAAE